ncbi:hypothetical protein [Planctomycetes bacterium CA13]|uniref:hypothetical protein n=1 Tax=Novipirellula herctigrandis TaxID=2527986 RepID=UPI0011B7368C
MVDRSGEEGNGDSGALGKQWCDGQSDALASMTQPLRTYVKIAIPMGSLFTKFAMTTSSWSGQA